MLTIEVVGIEKNLPPFLMVKIPLIFTKTYCFFCDFFVNLY